MYTVSLKNGRSFTCNSNTTIFEAAKNAGIVLEHSCLNARCRSCVVQVETGTTKEKYEDLVLTPEEKSNNWILSCNALPSSDLYLDIEDLGDIKLFDKKIIPAKIQTIKKLNETVILVSLRLPPSLNFGYNPGQYVNISKGTLKRSYSIANTFAENSPLLFYIKKYNGGEMSKYWFQEVKENDLLRIEGPFGSFFFRESEYDNIIFLATGTGIAPIKAIIESIYFSENKYQNKKIWLFNGARFESDLFWKPNHFIENQSLVYVPVLSKGSENWTGEKGYVQEVVLKKGIDLKNSQVYACGSIDMIESAKELLVEKGLNPKNFFSDAFVATN
jgi:CDP-4-dehydro-6-deoxyglucose reductase, E3